MEMKNENRVTRGEPRDESGKRPYSRPSIVMRETIEAVAAACVPSPPGKADVSCSLVSS